MAVMFPEDLQLSGGCFQRTCNYRDMFVNYRDGYLAVSWQKYATIIIHFKF